MTELNQRLQQEYEKLKTTRDELRVQLNLGKKEAEDAWREAEDKWRDLEAKMKLAGQISKETAEEVAHVTRDGASATLADVKQATDKLMDEVREGFEKMRKLI